MPSTLLTAAGWPTFETILLPLKLGLNAISEVHNEPTDGIFFFTPNVKNFTDFWLNFKRNGEFRYIFLKMLRNFWMAAWAFDLP